MVKDEECRQPENNSQHGEDLSRSCSHQRVHLVDKKDHVLAGLHVTQHRLEPLFELAAEL
jgi:hypothetical protein